VHVTTSSSEDEATQLLDPMLVRARSRIGVVLREKWRLDGLLGFGGMAAVYAATHRNGSRVAVKVLHNELSTNALVRQRFLREAYIANSIGHDGAVKVSDDDTAEDGSAFLIMELLDGETLEERRIRFGGRLGEDEVLSLADQLLDVLVAAHAKGIIHRDIKPENIFLTRSGQVKVLDFGIARLRELSSASNATKAGSTMGTPAYMAPEQARALWDEVDARTDLWAVGAVMFILLTGHGVHDGRTTNEVLLSAMTKPAPPLATVEPNIAPSVARAVDTALAFEKGARWPDAATMQEATRRAFHDRHGAPISTAPKLTVPPDVPNRTLVGAEASFPLPTATTGRPVAQSHTAMSIPATRMPWAILAGGAAVLGVVAVGIVGVVAMAHRSPKVSGTASTTATARESEPTTVASATSDPSPKSSTVSISDLPTVTSTKTTSATTTKGTPAVTPSTSVTTTVVAPVVKPNCTPPYVVDKNGTKKWKPECL
jgi:serine/threonine-protein kinase